MATHNQTRIMVFGTFDMIHRGHEHFFTQARALANHPFLIVSIARDVNVKRIKGKEPVHSESERLYFVAEQKQVDKVVLAGLDDHMPHIIQEHPHIIALGYDQETYVENLQRQLIDAGFLTKIVRLLPHKPHIYKTSLLRQNKKDA